MNKDFKRKITSEVMIFAGLMILLFFIVRLWPVVFLAIILLFVCAIRLLFLSSTKVETIEPAEIVQSEPKPATEQDVLAMAFSVIVKRITDYLISYYPMSRWVWAQSNAMMRIANGEPVSILLNKSGGYRKAHVLISNMQFVALKFESVEEKMPEEKPNDVFPSDDLDSDDADDETTNYELLAFEWVEKNLLSLNERCNEAIAQSENTVLISSEDLPDRDSWPDICKELIANDFAGAEMTKDGIRLNLPQ